MKQINRGTNDKEIFILNFFDDGKLLRAVKQHIVVYQILLIFFAVH